jgi:hypothetical protein
MPISIEEVKLCVKTMGLFTYDEHMFRTDSYISFDVIDSGQLVTVCAFVSKRIVLLFLPNEKLKYLTFTSNDEFSSYMRDLGCVLSIEKEKKRCVIGCIPSSLFSGFQ